MEERDKWKSLGNNYWWYKHNQSSLVAAKEKYARIFNMEIPTPIFAIFSLFSSIIIVKVTLQIATHGFTLERIGPMEPIKYPHVTVVFKVGSLEPGRLIECKA